MWMGALGMATEARCCGLSTASLGVGMGVDLGNWVTVL